MASQGFTEEWLVQHQQRLKHGATGTPRPLPAPSTPKPAPVRGFDPFLALLEANGLPAPELEYHFALPRQFRADYAWPAQKLIVERQGGLFSSDERAKRAHAMPLKILRDYEKSNLAQLAGWTYLQFSPEQLDRGDVIETLRIRLGTGLSPLP